MAKFYGKIGFDDPEEVTPGVWKGTTERTYRGNITRNYRRTQNSSDGTNDNIQLSNQISIVADPYAENHLFAMKWIEFQGAKWKITGADVARPRLNISIGGLYNENSN